jgi:hypothetical protein
MSHDPPETQGLGRVRETIEEPYQEYWRNLGRFIHYLAHAENDLIALLKTAANVTDEVGGALFHGTRVDSAKDILNHILESTGRMDAKNRLERPLSQLATISTVRNNLVHWGATHQRSDKLLVSNAKKFPRKVKEFHISPRDIQNICLDLERISLWLIFVDVYLEDNDHSELERWKPYLRRPWLYKPPQLSLPKTQPQTVRQSPKRPRGASQVSLKSEES